MPIHEQKPPDPVFIQILWHAGQRDGSDGGLEHHRTDLEPVNLVRKAAEAAGEAEGGGRSGEPPEEEGGAGEDEAKWRGRSGHAESEEGEELLQVAEAGV